MISKSQLVKRITGKAGLLPFDAEPFFEMFILQINDRMRAGEVFELKDLGYFCKKNCKLKSKGGPLIYSSEKDKPFPLILFSEEIVFNEDNKNIHFFSIPDIDTSEEDDIESHLSLSIEKPLVTESEFAKEIFSAFKSKSENRRNLASKAEIIINNMQKIDVEVIEEFTLKDYKRDFVEDEIEIENAEDSIVEKGDKFVGLTGDEQKDTFSSLPWDFGRKFFERKIEYPEQERIELQSKNHEEDKDEEGDKELKSPSEEKIIEETVREKLKEKPLVSSEGNKETNDDKEAALSPDEEEKSGVEESRRYERVRTFVPPEIKNKVKTKDDKSDIYKKEEKKTDKEKKQEDDFTPVKSKSETYRLGIRKKRKPFFKRKDSISLSDAKEKYEYHRQKRGILPFIIPIAILIIALTIVYFYLADVSIFSGETENVLLKVSPPPHVNIIERDFEFAVTFPYSKSGTNSEISGIDPSVFTKGIKLVDQKTKSKATEKEGKTKSEIITEQLAGQKEEPKVESRITSINKNISKYKDYYIVQVAAYRTYDDAEAEAEKFRNQGYNAFIEIAELPGRGTWYRIKVGDFTSVKHAEDFLTKNRN